MSCERTALLSSDQARSRVMSSTHTLAGKSTPMVNPYRRRALVWLFDVGTTLAFVLAWALISAPLVAYLFGGIPNPAVRVTSSVMIGMGFVFLGCSAGGWLATRLLSRPGRSLEGYNNEELRVMYKWLWKRDPLGRKLGKTHCHSCDHIRGSSVICPECGSHRIDPTE